MSPHSFKLTIVGAGRGGEALLKVLQDDSNIEVIAISDARTDAPALALAQSLHIPVFHTINELPACDMAINVTGSSEASQQLRGHYAGNVEIMEGKAAHFFYDQVGKRKQENEQVERMLTEFEKLNRVGRQLNNTNNLSQMLNLVLKESLQVTNSPAGTISLYDKTTRALSLHSAYGFSEGFENQEPWIVRQGGLTEHIFNERKPFVVPDIAKSDAFTLNSVLAIEGVAALVAVPLAIANEVVGILYVNDFSPRDYDENQVNILDMLANQATHAIQKARLFQAIEEEKNELRSLNENLETRIMERTSDLTKTNEELIRSNQAKSQFLSNMSHELRTPLTSINGFSEFLLDGFVGPLNEAQTKYLTNINVSGKHLLELINGILDLSKIESGKMSLKLEKVSIPPLLDEIILVLEGYAAKANVELELQYSEGIPAIFIDRTKFKQILYNLCSNAIKFSPEASKVSVDVNYSDPSNLSDNSVQYASLAIAVRDQGIGIAAKDQ
ncbi:MAG: histidine kinase, partial [Thalassolituus sp. CG17_big_fil_post_rev_8_21_14_2_50_53_8]